MNHFPSLPEMVKNLAKDILDHVLSGCKQIPLEDYKKRLGICNGCEFLKGGRCEKCGCWMNIKARMESVKCPIGKW
jgi:hypothetical protein